MRSAVFALIVAAPGLTGCYSYVAVQPRELVKLDQPEQVVTTTYPVIDDVAVPSTAVESYYALVREDGTRVAFYGDPAGVEIVTADHRRHSFEAPFSFATPAPDQVTVRGAHQPAVTYDWRDIQRARVDAPDDTATVAFELTASLLFVGACVALPFAL